MRFSDYILNVGYNAQENIEQASSVLDLLLRSTVQDRNSDNADVARAFDDTHYCLRLLQTAHEKLSDIIWDMKTLEERRSVRPSRYYVFKDSEPVELTRAEAEAMGLTANDEELLAEEEDTCTDDEEL